MLATSLIVVTKFLPKSNLREDGVILNHSLKQYIPETGVMAWPLRTLVTLAEDLGLSHLDGGSQLSVCNSSSGDRMSLDLCVHCMYRIHLYPWNR